MHPLPEDFSRASTVDIVRSVRCEALAGLESLLDLKPEERLKAIPIIKSTVIGYDFDFFLKEENDLGSPNGRNLLSFVRPDSLTLNVSAGVDLTRENTRTFTIIEPLAELIRPEHRDICKNRAKGPNWTYPVAGTIGLDELVRTYVKLELLTDLRVSKAVKPKKISPHVVFSDELMFSTKFEAGASGGIVLEAVVGRLRLKSAAVGAGASREDTHTVIVALAGEPDGGNRSGGSRTGAAAAKSTGSAKATGSAKSAAEERADLIEKGAPRDPRTQARLIQMNSEAAESVAVELHQRRARKDNKDNEAARALGQRFLDVLKVP